MSLPAACGICNNSWLAAHIHVNSIEKSVCHKDCWQCLQMPVKAVHYLLQVALLLTERLVQKGIWPCDPDISHAEGRIGVSSYNHSK